jgi:type I site-specific restriction-modification system R (restriction) subunit
MPELPNAVKWFNTRQQKGKDEVFDPVRKKYVVLTPEEEVRQQMMHFLVQKKGIPLGLMAVEYAISVNQLSKRCDIVVFSRSGNPLLIVECKAAHIQLNPQTLEQVVNYNMKLHVDFLIITNGKKLYCFQRDKTLSAYGVLNQIPDYEYMCNIAAENQLGRNR